MSINRRNALAVLGVGAAALPFLGACATNPVTGQVGLDPAVETQIQSAVATISAYIPTAETIVSLAVSLFGPQYASLVTLGSTALNTLIKALESVSAPPAAQAFAARFRRMGGRLKGAAEAAATGQVLIGNVNGVPIYAYK